MRRFFISSKQLSQTHPFIDGADAHHLRDVLRAKPGDGIVVLDGQGEAYHARVVTLDRDKVYIAIESSLRQEKESPVNITIAQALLKDNKKMDGLVRQLTELGITQWVPFVAGRSIPVPDHQRMVARYDRWRKITMEAVKQCRRSRAMTIGPVLTFDQVLAQAGHADLKIIFWEKHPDAEHLQTAKKTIPGRIFVMVGPEGGFEPGEIDQALQSGFQTAGMGPRILRAETATLAAAVLVQSIFGDLK